MNDTYSGGVIHTTHEMKLTVKTPSCITDPTITIPLRIGNKPLTKTGIGNVSGAFVYGTPHTGAVPAALPPFPMNMGGPNQDGETVVVSSAPPAGYSNPVVYSSVATPDPVITVGGYVNNETNPYSTISAVSFDSLLAEMSKSLNDLEVVTTRCNDSDWDHVFHSLTPLQYGQLIGKVWII